MNTMKRRRTQLSVVAAAVLAIVAVAAVMLLTGGAPAQADTAKTPALTPDGSSGNPMLQPTTTPRHASPERCPLTAARLVDSGHYALFDVYWNPDEGELTNTPCPPTVVHVPANEDDETPARDDRNESNINIADTVIHIPNSAKVDLSTSTTYTKDDYPQLWAADKLENRDTDNDGTPDGVGDGVVWALPACPTDGASTDGLCISFSAALLNPADWTGDIQFLLDHVHQIDIDKQDPRFTLAYGSATGQDAALWDSSDVRVVGMTVAPGEYERPTLFFTSRGTYEFQVHITGKPNPATDRTDGLKPVSGDKSVSSDVREYIIHVGAETDLGVEVSAEEVSTGVAPLQPGDNVTVTVTASNAGPETAPDTKVEVTLPQGLTHSTSQSPETTTGTYDSASGVWTIGGLAITNDDNTETDDDSPTLTITAQVGSNTRGQELTAEATISATETLEITEEVEKTKIVDGVETTVIEETVVEYLVPVADPDPSNNMDTGTITVASSANVAPIFTINGSIAENSAAGTTVIGHVLVRDADDASHTFTIDGAGAGNFQVDTAGNIKVAQDADLDYECEPSYSLNLNVSDGKDADGNPDTEIDDVLGLDIQLSDVTPTVTLSADDTTLSTGEAVNLTATTTDGPPTCSYTTAYQWHEDGSIEGGGGLTALYRHNTAGTRSYYLKLVHEGSDGVYYQYTSNTIQVTWTGN